MHKLVNGVKVDLTQEEIDVIQAEWLASDAAQQDYILNKKYIDDRAAAYPPIGDQLDAIMKQMNYWRMSGNDPLIQDMDDILSLWLSVKAQYPKPTGK